MTPLQIKVELYSKRSDELWDISEVSHSISISTQIWKSPGRAELTITTKDKFSIYEGDLINIRIDGYLMFSGVVFRKASNHKINEVKITCYDFIRYLSNHRFYQAADEPLTETFAKICKEVHEVPDEKSNKKPEGLKYEVVSTSSGIIEGKIFEDKSYADILQDRIDRQLAYNNELFFLHCKGDVIQLMQPKDALKDYILGDEAGILEYEYESSIDKNTYNEVVLYQDNVKTNERQSKAFSDANAIRAWGLLRIYKKVDNSMTIEQIQDRAEKMLSVYNKPTRTISFTCIGQPDMFAGSLLEIKHLTLQDMIYDGLLLIESCTHNISGEVHTMTLKGRIEKRD